MKVKRISIENFRSFLRKATLSLDGDISILIGPNGGGKTNLLDAMTISVRKYLFGNLYIQYNPQNDGADYTFAHNDQLNGLVFEKNSTALTKNQLVEIDIEVTLSDVSNMASMVAGVDERKRQYGHLFRNANVIDAIRLWKTEEIESGQIFTYSISNGNVLDNDQSPARQFLEYMRYFEIYNRMAIGEADAGLTTPFVYLPVNRSMSGFQSTVGLSGYNEFEQRRQNDAITSRNSGNIVSLAVSTVAQKYLKILHEDRGGSLERLMNEPNIKKLTETLRNIGYDWTIKSKDINSNQYDIFITKQGISFNATAASSGEKELLTYIFAIFALDVRDAIIFVDEPELHLHPKWQKSLLQIFIELARTTRNQFVLATHSPTFVSPESISFVSRVYSRAQNSNIVRLSASGKIDGKHLFNVINSQDNEKVFFADRVILVEGMGDRIFFEAVLPLLGFKSDLGDIVEIVDVGGKGMFPQYVKVLESCAIPFHIIADRDYCEQVGTEKIKSLFKVDALDIRDDVINNVGSRDGDALVKNIDLAVANGNWEHAASVWEYIKSRRRVLRADLDDTERELFRDFLEEMAEQGIHILSEGTLEAYLPVGYRSKDMNKLIELVSSPDLLERLPQEPLAEIRRIVEKIAKPIEVPQQDI
ncbi:chromosome segregation protein SMC [Mesorhizobium sp. M4A.F.Ca.ET.022.05.2.1]|uniref:ATP-dependent nuclease n=1 Tax=Mesorhizobium sp. M4A.F.Ca.ET.022.05.2.1 TaxID=2496653 RepID=UPI000FCA3FAB|nr:AAA family ATPase [Mesorhizobium sp. M4A.F.Ca.ET.022.05.2.1]RVC79306.1 chromosome segregation protein SMC [Mesorhizobium sp. M4A.F.Ca.ET.022.05.2.1]